MISLIKDLIPSLFSFVDSLHTSDEERAAHKRKLQSLIIPFETKVLQYQMEKLKVERDIIVGESVGQSWMQRNWRPITMLSFLFLVVVDTFGFTQFRLASEAWSLLQIGLGGYVIGRSAEKIIKRQ